MNAKVLIGLVIVVLVVAGVVTLVSGSNDDKNTTATATPVASVKPTASASATAKATVTVKLTDKGFEQNKITVKSGDTIFFDNSIAMEVASDPHPQHTNNPEFNGKSVAAGKGDVIKVTRKGTFGVHNHLNPSQHMTITVE